MEPSSNINISSSMKGSGKEGQVSVGDHASFSHSLISLTAVCDIVSVLVSGVRRYCPNVVD